MSEKPTLARTFGQAADKASAFADRLARGLTDRASEDRGVAEDGHRAFRIGDVRPAGRGRKQRHAPTKVPQSTEERIATLSETITRGGSVEEALPAPPQQRRPNTQALIDLGALGEHFEPPPTEFETALRTQEFVTPSRFSPSDTSTFEGRSSRFHPLYDPGSAQLVGYSYESQGLLRIFDIHGSMVQFSELGLAPPDFEPDDVLFVAGALKTAATSVGRTVLKRLSARAASRGLGSESRATVARIARAARNRPSAALGDHPPSLAPGLPQVSELPPILESAGARGQMSASPRITSQILEAERMGFIQPGTHQGASASARTARSLTTAIRADLGEAYAYYSRLARKEVGLQRPQGSNVRGPDYITAARDPDGTMWINVCDTKSRVSATSRFGRAKSSLPQTWREAVDDAVSADRLSFGDRALEQEIRTAWHQGRVRIRKDTVDFSPSGQGQVTLDAR